MHGATVKILLNSVYSIELTSRVSNSKLLGGFRPSLRFCVQNVRLVGEQNGWHTAVITAKKKLEIKKNKEYRRNFEN